MEDTKRDEVIKKIVEKALAFDFIQDPFILELQLKYQYFEPLEYILNLPIEDLEKKIAEIMGEDIDEENE